MWQLLAEPECQEPPWTKEYNLQFAPVSTIPYCTYLIHLKVYITFLSLSQKTILVGDHLVYTIIKEKNK